MTHQFEQILRDIAKHYDVRVRFGRECHKHGLASCSMELLGFQLTSAARLLRIHGSRITTRRRCVIEQLLRHGQLETAGRARPRPTRHHREPLARAQTAPERGLLSGPSGVARRWVGRSSTMPVWKPKRPRMTEFWDDMSLQKLDRVRTVVAQALVAGRAPDTPRARPGPLRASGKGHDARVPPREAPAGPGRGRHRPRGVAFARCGRRRDRWRSCANAA